MYNATFETSTEEAFVLASLKEFVKLWGSGSQASFQLECNNGQACFKLSSQLGSPADRHFVPPVPRRRDCHGVHGSPHKHPHPRQKGPAQRERNRARAAAHRAKQQLPLADKPAATADKDPASSVDPPNQNHILTPAETAGTEPSSPAAAAGHLPALPTPPSAPTPQPAASAVPPITSTEAVTADPAAGTLQVPVATLNEVMDELVEESEVIVYATGVFENCPDENLSEDYFVSLQKFLLSENHLKNNITNINTAHLTSRRLRSQMFIHTVKVEIGVKTARLWEPPLAYINKHLAKNDWLKGNKTRITLVKIHI